MFEIKKKECDNVKKLLKLTSAVVGVAAVAGTTAYVLTQTEKGRELTARTKKKVSELKEALCKQLEAYQAALDEESVMEATLIVYDYEDEFVVEEGLDSLPKPFVEPLIPVSKETTNPSRLLRERRQSIWSLYDQGVDAESIASSLNLPFEVVLKDLAYGEKRGRLEY